jgi:transposase
MSNICSYYGVKPNTYRKYYKRVQSGFKEWEQHGHCDSYMLFSENMGSHLSIDEIVLSKGELYTIVSNKAGKAKKGTIVACIADTKAEVIAQVLRKLPVKSRGQVQEVTLDMAPNMALASKESFPNARLVTDRFHVIRLALDAVQQIRTQFRWKELDIENKAIAKARKERVNYTPKTLSNGDTPEQLLARSRYILAKKESQWTPNQQQRAQLLFTNYPEIQIAYLNVIKLRAIYEEKKYLDALVRLKTWIDSTRKLNIKQFNSVGNSIENHFTNILNFFHLSGLVLRFNK